MKKMIIILLTILLVFLSMAYTIGYFNDGVDAIISSIPLLGDFFFILDSYEIFIIFSSGEPFTISLCTNIITYIISIMVSCYVCTIPQGLDNITKILLGIIVSFFLTILLKMFFIEFYLNFIVNGFDLINNSFEKLLQPI